MFTVDFIGNLTQDVKVENNANGKYGLLKLAINERDSKGEKTTTYVSAFINDINEGVVKYLTTGSKVRVFGVLSTSIYNEAVQYSVSVKFFEIVYSKQGEPGE